MKNDFPGHPRMPRIDAPVDSHVDAAESLRALGLGLLLIIGILPLLLAEAGGL